MKIGQLRKKFKSDWWNDRIPFSEILKLKKRIEQMEMQNEVNKNC